MALLEVTKTLWLWRVGLDTQWCYVPAMCWGTGDGIVYSDAELELHDIRGAGEPEHPILIEVLENAIEVDVDAIADHTGRVVVMAGTPGGDSL